MTKKQWIAIGSIGISAILIIVVLLGVLLSNKNDGSLSEEQTVKISCNFGYKKDAWQAVVDDYNTTNTKKIKVVLDEQSGSSYDNWLRNELFDDNSTTSIVINNAVSEYYPQNKFVNMNNYTSRKNTYNGNKIWKNTLADSAFIASGYNGEVYNMNYESTATCWYYNKDMFEQYNINPPTNWDELINVCEVLASKDITPLSISADTNALISWQIGWLLRLYSDQFFRDEEQLVLAQAGDYCYDAESQQNFVFDKTNVNNDAEAGFVVNPLRFMKLVNDGTIGPDSPKFKALLSEIMRLIPTYVHTDFLTMDTSDSQKRFINSNAAMYIGLMEFGAGWERTINDSGVANIFDIGTFNNPPMTNELCSVDYVRSMGGASGSLGIINRSQKHNDAAADFLMYFSSVDGQSLYFSKLAELNVAPSGPSLVNNVTLPEKWAGIFENISFNGLADKNTMTYFSRGFWEVASTNTTYVANARKLFDKKLTIDEYCGLMQAECRKGIIKKLSIYEWDISSLDDVTKNPKA